MAAPTTSGSPRAAVGAFLVLSLLLVGVAVAVAVAPTPAGASGLEPFSGCAALEAWTASAGAATSAVVAMESNAAPTTTGAPVPADAADDRGSGATNTAVVGVDELDLVDEIDAHRHLVVGLTGLGVLDLRAGKLVSHLEAPAGSQVTFDPEANVAWVVGSTTDGSGVEVRRVRVTSTGLQADAAWRTPGQLVDARRLGDHLVLVATDGAVVPGGVPFRGGPVPCDQVLHPELHSDGSATLLVDLPVAGPLRPAHAAEVVGSGQLVHVVDDAAYLATPQWQPDGTTTTGIHRFSLPDLRPTASGSVDGALLGDLAMSDDGDGHLRVAVTEAPTMVAVDDVAPVATTIGPDAGVADGGAPVSSPVEEPPGTAVPTPAPAKNRIVVLDAAGDLHQLGATPWFGHPGERLQGVRFDGDVAYAVTFLQTDPFFVVDLADPTAPKVVGQVELPGFSSYLHPLGGGMVLGFGPGADGQAEAKLFDASDPAKPRLVDTVALGGDAPVAYDRHALVDLGGGRVAVVVTRYVPMVEPVCPDVVPAGGTASCSYPGPTAVPSEIVVLAAGDGRLRVEARHQATMRSPAQRVVHGADGWALLSGDQAAVLTEGGAVRATLDLP